MPKRFSASSAAQLMACPGSANLELAIPGFEEPVRDPTAGAKGVGTSVHAVLEPIHALTGMHAALRSGYVWQYSQLHYLKRRALADDPVEAASWLRNYSQLKYASTAEVEWLQSLRDLPPKMLRFISEACAYMADLLQALDVTDVISAEETLIANWLPSRASTTPDVSITAEDRLEVIDYKSGAIPVSPVDNDQLLFYAACLRHRAPQATEFTLHIVQPGNLDSWTAPIAHLDRWMSKAIEADRAIQRKELTLQPSDHCTFCPANPHSRGDKGNVFCPAMLNKLYPPVIDEDEIFAVA